jgi:hypothetical protein
MCHPSVLAYVGDMLDAETVRGSRILDVGSYDVNGSARTILQPLEPASYTGVDMSHGPGVDEVVDVVRLAEWVGEDRYDIVVSTEMLEHVRDWAASLRNLLEAVVDGGLLLITTRAPGFPYHPFPEDHWRYPPEVMRVLLETAGFKIFDCQPDPDPASPGVCALATRPHGWQWPDTAPQEWANAGVQTV